MFIASGSVLFLTHSHHAGITVKQCTRHWQPEPSQFDGMQLIAHAESNTGFISIVNVPSDHGLFRVMRCDHSIIGGGYLDYNLDSIFGSFYFMDFVRYITRKEDTKQVLQIGLGIGVSARTLLKTGYQVDIVELDPKVYDYAKKYFDLPEPRSYYIGDGRYYVDAIAQNQTYDFVLHDVFTGGLVPKTLFSIECMASIKRILKPNGVLAVNFVGNSHSEGTLVVLKTLKEIFKTVAIFTEPQAEESEFFNMVIYCSSMNEIGFEFPDEDEIPFKGTYQSVLGQFAHSHLKMPDLEGKQVITDKHNPLEKLQVDSARAHWKVMRQVLKEAFWMEMY
ncbi:S-adenosyl-L-methionine-dependent methyltransferase [Gorgonomyces haynaldii]|nr:S-adenosyl-L-methionine-dependent methyltransferase [Gorgonomyces haynaldii]